MNNIMAWTQVICYDIHPKGDAAVGGVRAGRARDKIRFHLTGFC